MHVVVKIAVAIFIFWCGVQFGELKAAIRSAYYGSDYGYGMMSGYGIERNQNYTYGPGMMGRWTTYSVQPAPVPTVPAATTVPKK